MADYVTNLIFVNSENEKDLVKIEAFLNETFEESKYERSDENIEGEFFSRRYFPQEEFEQLTASLEAKDLTCIRILAYDFPDEYVCYRIFSQGQWKIML